MWRGWPASGFAGSSAPLLSTRCKSSQQVGGQFSPGLSLAGIMCLPLCAPTVRTQCPATHCAASHAAVESCPSWESRAGPLSSSSKTLLPRGLH